MKKNGGFSLVEVMVVLVILALTITFAIPGFERLESDRLEKQAGQLSSWLQGVSDNAVLDGAVYGAWLDSSGQRLHTGYFYNNRWWRVDDELFESPRLEKEAELLLGDGSQWRPLAPGNDKETLRPALLFLPAGTTRPRHFELRLHNDPRRARIEQDADGMFVWRML